MALIFILGVLAAHHKSIHQKFVRCESESMTRFDHLKTWKAIWISLLKTWAKNWGSGSQETTLATMHVTRRSNVGLANVSDLQWLQKKIKRQCKNSNVDSSWPNTLKCSRFGSKHYAKHHAVYTHYLVKKDGEKNVKHCTSEVSYDQNTCLH